MSVVFAFVRQGFRQQGAYKVEGWLGVVSSLIWFTLNAGIWTALLRDRPEALARQIGYVIAVRFLSELNFFPTWEVGAKFRQGDVGLELIKPVALPVRVLGDFLGRSCFRLLRALPAYVLIWALYRLPVPSLDTLALFVLTSLLGWVIAGTITLSLSLIALWTVQFDQAEQLFDIFMSAFSGVFIPLHYLPAWVQAFAPYLPFAGVYYVPAAVLSGDIGGTALVQALALQVLWAVVGLGVLTAMWRAGSRKLVMQGG